VKKLGLKQILLYLTIAFVIVSIWQSPASTAEQVGNFLEDVGGFLLDLIDKSVDFIDGLFSGDDTNTPPDVTG
jgi:hypothetical protein